MQFNQISKKEPIEEKQFAGFCNFKFAIKDMHLINCAHQELSSKESKNCVILHMY